MDRNGHIYLTEGKPPEEDRRRFEQALREDRAEIEARVDRLIEENSGVLKRLEDA